MRFSTSFEPCVLAVLANVLDMTSASERFSRRAAYSSDSCTARWISLGMLQAVDCIQWPEGFCRRDIGWRALQDSGQ